MVHELRAADQVAAEPPAANAEPGRVDPDRSFQRRQIQLQLTATVVLTNVVGAVVASVLIGLVVPMPQQSNGAMAATSIAVVVYLVVAVVIGTAWGTAWLERTLQWAIEDREPNAADRTAALRAPLVLVRVQALLWGLAAVGFTVANGVVIPAMIPAVAFSVLIVGMVTCAVTYLASERILRPVAALALADEPPAGLVIPGLRARSLMAWGLGSAIPIVGLILVAVFALARGDATPTRLSVTIIAIGGATLVVGWLLVAVASQAILDPVRDLGRALEAVEEGDLDTSVEVYDGTEIGQLQSGFNRMVSGLRERERLRDLFGRHVGADVAAQALASPSGLGGEVREAAVLFVDLVASTQLASTRPPTEVVALLNRFFTAAVEVVDDHHGWVNKFEGDGALALFGTPVALDDPAGAALHAARRLAGRLGTDIPEVRAGIGVVAGTVVAGNIGAVERFEYTVIGDPVNEAARLTEVAKTLPSGVATSAETVARACAEEQRHWVVGQEVTLRGRETPTRVVTPRDLLDAPDPDH
jgi:class 3 adenylate cyclase